jgi:hypothetical protein
MPSPIRRSPMQAFMRDTREIGQALLWLLITPALWLRVLRLLGKALILLGKRCGMDCSITWQAWRLGMTRAQVRSIREDPWRSDT